MSTLILNCRGCNTPFEYSKKEFTRQTKLGREKDGFSCSRSCSMKYRNKNRTSEEQEKISAKLSVIFKNNTHAKKSEFTYYLAKSRNRNKENNLTKEYLEELWLIQNGKCALSNVEIELKKGKSNLFTASLDRIDSNTGYIKGNVQFVCYGLNLAKNNFPDNEIRDLVNRIKISITS